MRIALYGMPAAGKTYFLEKLDFIEVVAGSRMLREMCPDFDNRDEAGKREIREKLADFLGDKDSFIIDGHYAFGDKIAFTEKDGQLYDAFLYLYISPDMLRKRMEISERNRKYLDYDLEEWQKKEIESLRTYCHENDKDFYVIDNPPGNVFDDVSEVIEFIRVVVEGYSCISLAKKTVAEILEKSKSDCITLMDGDKTITMEDTSNKVFGYTTQLYDGNFYTGYQAWRQAKEFKSYDFDDLTTVPVSLNEKVVKEIGEDTYILTSGHERIWGFMAKQLNVSFYYGVEMSAETKFFITKMLQTAGKKVIAYGDGMNDYYMLKQADKGYLVTKQDSRISRSLKGKDLKGLRLV